MSRLEIVLICFSLLMFFFNISLFWLLRQSMSRLLSFSDEMKDLREMTGSFSEHVSSVYELDTFYGDQTLQGLMEHARAYKEQLDTFEYIYGLSEEGNQLAESETAKPDTEEETEEDK